MIMKPFYCLGAGEKRDLILRPAVVSASRRGLRPPKPGSLEPGREGHGHAGGRCRAGLRLRATASPGFTDPVEFKLTVDLVRIQLAAPIIFGLSGLTMGILNSHQSFLWPALAPAMYSIGKILGVVLLVPSMGVYGLAVGVVGGLLGTLLGFVVSPVRQSKEAPAKI